MIDFYEVRKRLHSATYMVEHQDAVGRSIHSYSLCTTFQQLCLHKPTEPTISAMAH